MKRTYLATACLALLAPLPGVAQDADAGPESTVRWVLAPEASEARYRIREQLAGLDFPNDAVGATSAISGALVLDGEGHVVAEQSRFVVEMATLVSDRDRRDGYVRRRILLTDEHPEVVFVPTEIRGLATPVPTGGEHTFELVGDLTITGTTRTAIWQVTATFSDGVIAGLATTNFTFEDFGLTRPRVRIVLSVEDDIQLELDLRLIREPVP